MYNLVGMDLKQIRLLNLDRYLKHECGGNAAELARRIKRSPSQVNDLFAGRKSFGEKLARAIENEIGAVSGCLDLPAEKKQSATATLSLSANLSEIGLSPGAAQLVRLIRQRDKAGTLSPALLQALEQMIRAATPPTTAKQAQGEEKTADTAISSPVDAPTEPTEPTSSDKIDYTPDMRKYDPTRRVAKKPKTNAA